MFYGAAPADWGVDQPLGYSGSPGAIARTLKETEWLHIQRVLEEEKGSVGRAAKRLGVPRSSLYQKLKLREPPNPSSA